MSTAWPQAAFLQEVCGVFVVITWLGPKVEVGWGRGPASLCCDRTPLVPHCFSGPLPGRAVDVLAARPTGPSGLQLHLRRRQLPASPPSPPPCCRTGKRESSRAGEKRSERLQQGECVTGTRWWRRCREGGASVCLSVSSKHYLFLCECAEQLCRWVISHTLILYVFM